jgi:hypothetical protein
VEDAMYEAEPLKRTSVNLGSWALRVAAWDAVLPLFVMSIPFGLKWLFPEWRGLVELASVVMPIIAFLIRLTVGVGHIRSNHCSLFVKKLQVAFLCFGIMPLVFLECILALSALGPGDPMFGRETQSTVMTMVFIYLFCMLIAMYPGSAPVASADDRYDISIRD